MEGAYTDLFLSSDAMNHDSGSFLIEYIYTGKPILHTTRDEHITERINAFGVLAYYLTVKLQYHAKKESNRITGGTFDMFHSNHVKMIEYARGLGDVLIVGVSTDELICCYKSPLSIPFEERIEII